jgi:hypothetical protein
MDRTKPARRRKPRGRRLAADGCLRLRDLLAALLVWELELSLPDAARVLSLGAISEDHIRRRLKACPPNIREIFRTLHEDEETDVA